MPSQEPRNINWPKLPWASEKNQKKILAGLGTAAKILFGTYILASTLGVVIVSLVTEGGSPSAGRIAKSTIDMPKRPFVNYRNLRKAVVARNIFNSDGEVPDETLADTKKKDTGPEEFDENAPCSPSKLPLVLVGTIAQRSKSNSIATIKEQGISQADVYRVGDLIIGQDNASLYAIFHRKVVINNNGVKECLEIRKSNLADRVTIKPRDPVPTRKKDEVPAAGGDGSNLSFTNDYIVKSLGPGFSKILATGRLVPYNNGQRMLGFRLVGVKNDSLWKKLGLSSGDVLVKVNDTDMTKPDQGFGLYEALSEEQVIRIEYLKNGETPTTKTIEIR